MSGNNYRECPRCIATADKSNQERQRVLDEGYGRIPQDEYLAALRAMENPVQYDFTLREDYQLRVDKNGVFTVYYECTCEACGFTHRFDHSENLEV